jgi:hypothetical protein
MTIMIFTFSTPDNSTWIFNFSFLILIFILPILFRKVAPIVVIVYAAIIAIVGLYTWLGNGEIQYVSYWMTIQLILGALGCMLSLCFYVIAYAKAEIHTAANKIKCDHEYIYKHEKNFFETPKDTQRE